MWSPQSSQFWLVPHKCYVFSATANSLQLSPFALAATIFNIPQTVMPFKMTFKSFTVVVFVIVVMSFGALSAFRRRRKKNIAWTNAVPLDGMPRRRWTSDYAGRLMLGGARNRPETPLESV
jgi:hypothetical protein